MKAGHVQAAYVRDLRGVIEREKAEIGVLISMEHPTKPMLKEAAEAGFYQPPGLTDKYPRMQILSIAELFGGKKIEYPRLLDVTFKKGAQGAESRGGADTVGRERHRRAVLSLVRGSGARGRPQRLKPELWGRANRHE